MGRRQKLEELALNVRFLVQIDSQSSSTANTVRRAIKHRSDEAIEPVAITDDHSQFCRS